MTIWKFELSVEDQQVIRIPKNAKILCVQIQNNTPCLWVLLNPNNELMPITINTYGTGNPINDYPTGKYIGTYQLMGGGLVYHVFKD